MTMYARSTHSTVQSKPFGSDDAMDGETELAISVSIPQWSVIMTFTLHFRLSYYYRNTQSLAHGKRKWQGEKLE